ncbi:hypothetical protein EUA06_05880 [Nocardioides glacieisoli]|uniref:Lipoprotein n=1 Tax=Nocardioides glacieisoli TaxID=1168730 RepID=A0A4Q2RTX9_9ACTN|nr:hypothetical protein [Nocardioides glacieisoli]RYB92477.1 hypothetical protein EUA06_05880 [Nocardioides glacieisoli]
MHVRRILALALAGPLLLAGCSDPEPILPDPPTTSPSPTTPSPTDSETPEQESAEDFIRRWADENQRMFVTGDTERFLSLGPDCDDCKRIAETVDGIYDGGGSVEWDGWKILNLAPRGAPSANAFRFVVRSAPTRYRETANGPWKQLEGGRGVQLIVLKPVDSSWQVLESKELPG